MFVLMVCSPFVQLIFVLQHFKYGLINLAKNRTAQPNTTQHTQIHSVHTVAHWYHYFSLNGANFYPFSILFSIDKFICIFCNLFQWIWMCTVLKISTNNIIGKVQHGVFGWLAEWNSQPMLRCAWITWWWCWYKMKSKWQHMNWRHQVKLEVLQTISRAHNTTRKENPNSIQQIKSESQK